MKTNPRASDVDHTALDLMWESFTPLQKAAINHSVDQQVRRAHKALPIVISEPTDFQERYRYALLSDIYSGDVELAIYEEDYKTHLEKQHIPLNKQPAEDKERSVIGNR